MTLVPQSTVVDIETMLKARLIPNVPDSFSLKHIADIVPWSGKPSAGLRARILIALHSVNHSTVFSDACAEAIANADDWNSLLAILLNGAQVSPSIVATACKVLHRRMPEHALSQLSGAIGNVTRICDAVDDGSMLRVTRLAWSGLGEGRCWLIGLANPADQLTEAVATFDDANVVINLGEANWLERSRFACPAFLAVAS